MADSKVIKNEKKDANKDLDPKDVIQNLRTQLEEYLKQSDNYKTMAVKAQGALEVLLQLHPEEDKHDG